MLNKPMMSRPFTPSKIASKRVDQIALLMAAYIVLVLLPGYEWLRFMWSEHHLLFEWQRWAIAGAAALSFAAYARHTMRKYLSLGRKPN